MRDAYTHLPTVSEGALPVQVHGPAAKLRTDNVIRSPLMLPAHLPLADHDPGGDDVVSLDDLAVSADADRLYLISMSRDQPVEPLVFSAVEFANHAHPMMRFLCEITTSATASCAPFSWGTVAGRLPFLPRVRYRRSILSPAMWTLTANDLPDRGLSSFRLWLILGGYAGLVRWARSVVSE